MEDKQKEEASAKFFLITKFFLKVGEDAMEEKEKEDASAKEKKQYQIFFKKQSFPFYFGACDAMEDTDKKDASAKFFLFLTKF